MLNNLSIVNIKYDYDVNQSILYKKKTFNQSFDGLKLNYSQFLNITCNQLHIVGLRFVGFMVVKVLHFQ